MCVGRDREWGSGEWGRGMAVEHDVRNVGVAGPGSRLVCMMVEVYAGIGLEAGCSKSRLGLAWKQDARNLGVAWPGSRMLEI